MKHRDKEGFDNLDEIIHHLGDPDRIGKSGTWVAKNYSLSQLIKDLQKVKEKKEEDIIIEDIERLIDVGDDPLETATEIYNKYIKQESK